MEQRFNYLLREGTIQQEDKKVLSLICKGSTEEISLLDLTGLKARLEKYLSKTTTENQDRITLYLGLIKLVSKFTEDWGTVSGKIYRIM